MNTKNASNLRAVVRDLLESVCLVLRLFSFAADIGLENTARGMLTHRKAWNSSSSSRLAGVAFMIFDFHTCITQLESEKFKRPYRVHR
jgi:hypothetical protein